MDSQSRTCTSGLIAERHQVNLPRLDSNQEMRLQRALIDILKCLILKVL